MPSKSIGELLEERDEAYGPAWQTSSMVLRFLRPERHPIGQSNAYFPWIMIMNKLHRAMQSPDKRDHWEDIMGYAQLVLGEIDEIRPDSS